MTYSYDKDKINENKAAEMINELNKLAPIGSTSAAAYLKSFIECIRAGAIKEIEIYGTRYELYADILETEE